MLSELKKTADKIRMSIFKAIAQAGGGHFGGVLSEIEILTVLYFNELKIDPKNPGKKDRDRFVLSKGHGGPGLYATLAERGFFPKEWLKELPGPYTLILKPKDKNVVAKNVAPKKRTLGVRLPDHWFTNLVKDVQAPLVTTSVNKAGKMFMTDKDNLDPEIEKGVSFLIYEGEKKGRPSKVVDLVEGKIKER